MKKEKISKDKLDKFKELVDNAETIAIASNIRTDGAGKSMDKNSYHILNEVIYEQ